ncbi:ORF6N domain-containing protein [Clostridium botulinum]|uniref:ORF6N domain-containing protein n=1 Tax=Clostridium botulinum TaxID=1491 RepID=UPI001C9A7898|nr:ORF6N domain-containing protein [Clostridium botulinum]MBY6838865.1 ORF6N domain-containing protein [Clostridium botulinum]
MKNELEIKGITEIDEMKFNNIEGGFGENKKCILAKDIANIHKRELKLINQNINRNRKRFKDNVDIIDLKNGNFEQPLKELGFSQRDITISKNIYMLSERGYSKLLKILEDDVAWEQYEKIVDGYFNMRQTLNTSNIKVELENILEKFTGKLLKIEYKLGEDIQRLEQKQDELETYYKPTHRNKLGYNSFIKSCLGDNATKENCEHAKEQLLFLLGDYTTYQEVPKDTLESMNTKALVYDICKNINNSIKECI